MKLTTLGRQRLLGVEPVRERRGERGQVEEELLALDELRRLAVDPAARLDEVDGVELVAAVVALVAAGRAVPADRAGALDVAVGQRAAGGRADGAELRLREDVAVGEQPPEQLLHDGVVVLRGGAGEQVVGQPELLQVARDDPAVLVGEGSRGGTPSFSAWTRIGVPCSSVPLTISTWLPAIRWYRLNTSDGTPKPATWPMCRGPLAYGQATAVRTWVMRSSLVSGDRRGFRLARRARQDGPLLRHEHRLAQVVVRDVADAAASLLDHRADVVRRLAGLLPRAAASVRKYTVCTYPSPPNEPNVRR